jgi:hypothetical protein
MKYVNVVVAIIIFVMLLISFFQGSKDYSSHIILSTLVIINLLVFIHVDLKEKICNK